MSKFKVGDKVKIKCSENNTLLEEVFVEDKILFEITSVYYNDTKKMWAYKIRDLKNIFVFDYVEDELELYKTPHQELLDLEWELSKVDNRYIEYINEEDDYLIIDKIEKTYYNLSSYYRPFDINLQLARILVRYLEEL